MAITQSNHQLIRAIEAQVLRLSGRQYRIDWSDLDPDPLREVLRLLRDLEYDKDAAVQRAQRHPWRRT